MSSDSARDADGFGLIFVKWVGPVEVRYVST